jgi:chromosome partitioning protein
MLMKTKIIVVVNQKGGVGKSTIAFHLAHAALKKKKTAKVLAIDLDSQGNLSQYLTGELDVINVTTGGVGDVFEGVALSPIPTTHPQIDLLHGHSALDRYDSDEEAEARVFSSECPSMLRSLGYDYIVIDTPPAVGLRHLAPLFWADTVVIPLEPVMSGIVGFQNVLTVLNESITPLNPDVKWVGLLNRANMRVRSHREKEAFMRESYDSPGHKRILATLSTRTSVSDAMEETPAQPVWLRKGAPKELSKQWLDVCLTALRV